MAEPQPTGDAAQEAREFFKAARLELLLYGFAVVKQMATFATAKRGSMQCPLCGKQVKYSIASSNGHCAARCETNKCINAQE